MRLQPMNALQYVRWYRKDFIKYGHEKTETDKIILSEIIDKASQFEHEEYNTHFLLGTAFYNSPHPYYFMDGMIQSTKNWLTVYVRVCSFILIRNYLFDHKTTYSRSVPSRIHCLAHSLQTMATNGGHGCPWKWRKNCIDVFCCPNSMD